MVKRQNDESGRPARSWTRAPASDSRRGPPAGRRPRRGPSGTAVAAMPPRNRRARGAEITEVCEAARNRVLGFATMCAEMHGSAIASTADPARPCTPVRRRNLHTSQEFGSCSRLDLPIALHGDNRAGARVVDGENCHRLSVLSVRILPTARHRTDDHHSFGRFRGPARTLAVGTAFALTGSTARRSRTLGQREGKAS